MIDFSRNYFELFGLPQRFRFDATRLDSAYHALQNEVHPDRHADGGDAQRRVALQSSAHVNAAYGALKDPVARANYLLGLHGIDALAETDTALPLEFLERQLERREEAEEAVDASDDDALRRILDGVRAEARALEDDLADRLDDKRDYESARTVVRELKFLAKLTDDLAALEARFDDL